jgi:hypothetical protein
MKAIVKEPWVRMTYTKPENEMTVDEKAECDRFEASINEAAERLHEKTSVGLIEIEPYPCCDDCEHCKADAA